MEGGIGRHQPAKGVYLDKERPTLVFVTVCTKDRHTWLDDASVQDHLVKAWNQATAWKVGPYILMPDHLHLVCGSQDLRVSIETWVTYWKRLYSKSHQDSEHRFQTGCFHHRLRDTETLLSTETYLRNNPVRKGFVTKTTHWPHQGTVFQLSDW
jgi:putative transposase